MLGTVVLVDKIKPEAESGTSRLFSWYALVGQFAKMSRMAWPSANPKHVPADLDMLLKSLKAETEDERERRLLKQRFENYIPLADRRPLDEFFDLNMIEKDCICGPIDVKLTDEPGTFKKYVMRASISKYGRKIEPNDLVYYKCETRFANG